MEYTMECRVRYSEAMEDAKVHLPRLLDYFQDCATFHTQDIGIGFNKGIMKGRGWFLLAYEVTIYRKPVLFENLTIKTVPYHMRRYYGYRYFYVYDEQGNCIVEADSIWILMDLKKLIPVKIPDKMSRLYVEQEDQTPITIKRKITIKDGNWKKIESIPVQKMYIDTNFHVNNTWYVVWAQDLLPEDKEIHSIKIEYRQAAKLDDLIDIYLYEEDDQWYLQYVNQDDTVNAVLKLKLKKKEEN